MLNLHYEKMNNNTHSFVKDAVFFLLEQPKMLLQQCWDFYLFSQELWVSVLLLTCKIPTNDLYFIYLDSMMIIEVPMLLISINIAFITFLLRSFSHYWISKTLAPMAMGKTFGRIKVAGGKIINWNGYHIEGLWSLLSKDVTISIVKPTYSIQQLIETLLCV